METIITFELDGKNPKAQKIKHFKGELDLIIVNFPVKGELLIESELGYTIFQSRNMGGVQYIPIRVAPLNNMGHQFNYQGEKYKLNEKLIITINLYTINKIDPIKIIFR